MSKILIFRALFFIAVFCLPTMVATAQEKPLGHQSEDEAAVLKAIDDFMITLTTQDLERRGE
ncbi:MAG TPA: hypothetical protein DCE78_10235 [Bacteroidetes bacterium]|nr:hypothetical protein [Bacteroidota bacterium]